MENGMNENLDVKKQKDENQVNNDELWENNIFSAS